MRVLHVDSAREWRGGQVQLLQLAMSQAEHDEVAMAMPSDSALLPAGRRAGLRVFPVPFRGALRGTAALRSAASAWEPELLAAHTPHALTHALRLGLPVVAHRRVDFVPRWWGASRLRAAAGVIAVSEAVRSILLQRGVRRVTVVPDGVADPAPSSADPRRANGLVDVPLLVSVGALVPHKGHAVLVEALTRLPGVHVVVLGEGPQRRLLEDRAARCGIAHRVHWLGQRSDVAEWRAVADVVVHPSLQEGLGQAVIEALLQGCAVVATAAGGIPEAIADRGVLVAPGDAVALAHGIERALQGRDALQSSATTARAALRARFGVAQLVAGTRAAYAGFLQAASPIPSAARE